MLCHKLLEGLEEIMLTIKVRVGSEYGEEFKTIIGIMQGDYLNAILFFFHIACAFADHNHTITSIHPPEVAYLIRKTYMKTVHGQNANYYRYKRRYTTMKGKPHNQPHEIQKTHLQK